MTSPPTSATSRRRSDPPEPEQVIVRLRTPGEIVSSLPALLGYHAESSIVLILLGGPRRRLRLTMRLDLPERRDDIVWRAVWQSFEPGVRNADADEAILVLIDGDEMSADSLTDVLTDGLDGYGVSMRDVLVVVDGRYRSIFCDDDACCPPEGTPAPQTAALTVASVTSGRVIGADRDDLRREILPPAPQAAQRAEKVLALMVSTVDLGSMQAPTDDFAGYLDLACDAAAEGDLPLDQAARLACLVAVGDYRDKAYLHMVGTDSQATRAMWASVCRQLPARHTVVPHVLFALSAYLQGEGSLATVALEAAEETDARHPSVTLLGDIMAAGIPPEVLRATLAESMAPRR